MNDCCIRVTALLECFERTMYNNTGSIALQPCHQCQVVGSDFWCYYGLIFKGCVPLTLNHYWYQKGVWSLYFVIVTFKTNE